MAWPPAKGDLDAACRAARDAAGAARDAEYRRLLYVAMTRAEDRLYACGWATRRAASATCWHTLIGQALVPVCTTAREPLLDGESDGGQVWRLKTPQRGPVGSGGRAAGGNVAAPLPAWATAPPAAEPKPSRPLFPSRPETVEPALPSPRLAGPERSSPVGTALRRGRLVHRLLQHLPDLAPDRRAAAGLRLLAPFGLDPAGEQALLAEVLALLAESRLSPLFGPGSRAEVPLVGRLGDRVVSGQVDRLVVTADAVLVVDYKTGVPPPADPGSIPVAYRAQMAAYRGVLRQIYPSRPITCALLWTDGPCLMTLPDDF